MGGIVLKLCTEYAAAVIFRLTCHFLFLAEGTHLQLIDNRLCRIEESIKERTRA